MLLLDTPLWHLQQQIFLPLSFFLVLASLQLVAIVESIHISRGNALVAYFFSFHFQLHLHKRFVESTIVINVSTSNFLAVYICAVYSAVCCTLYNYLEKVQLSLLLCESTFK